MSSQNRTVWVSGTGTAHASRACQSARMAADLEDVDIADAPDDHCGHCWDPTMSGDRCPRCGALKRVNTAESAHKRDYCAKCGLVFSDGGDSK